MIVSPRRRGGRRDHTTRPNDVRGQLSHPFRLRVLCASAVIPGEHRSDPRAWLSGSLRTQDRPPRSVRSSEPPRSARTGAHRKIGYRQRSPKIRVNFPPRAAQSKESAVNRALASAQLLPAAGSRQAKSGFSGRFWNFRWFLQPSERISGSPPSAHPCATSVHWCATPNRLRCLAFSTSHDSTVVLGQNSVALARFQRLFGPESDA